HLRISKEEQKRRLLARLDDPSKRWKFAPADVAERSLWHRHMQAYEDMLGNTSTPETPWYVVPADHKWFAHLAIADIMVDVLDGLALKSPPFDPAAGRTNKQIRTALEAD